MRTAKPSLAERAYRMLLRLLPADFRAEFGHEMEGVFLDEQREAARAAGTGAWWRLWLRTLGGIVATAPAQHADVLKQDLTYAGRTLARTPVFAGPPSSRSPSASAACAPSSRSSIRSCCASCRCRSPSASST